MLKVFVFCREVRWGCGCAIVVAQTEQEATNLLMQKHPEDNWICEGKQDGIVSTRKRKGIVFIGTYAN